jgi:electron transfer flavoprotein alpha subunit
MSGVLAILEATGGVFHRLSFETVAAAQQIATGLSLPVSAAVPGDSTGNAGSQAAAAKLEKVYTLGHTLLKDYTPDAYTEALAQLIRAVQPKYVVLPHTYQVRDFAPRLATRFSQVLASDIVEVRAENGAVTPVRQLFQGKLNADIRLSGDGPFFLSVQAGAFRAEAMERGEGPAPIEPFEVQLDAAQVRTKPGEPFRESQRAVDLTSAELIVSVGRGIREKENITIVEELAQALGAELAASRPICDNGWLPMERQVGSSGQTVAPKVYLAVGISGAIQHLVGMKGAKTIVAINKDPDAPIFEVADYGVVGDLFEVVPALTAEVRKLRG